MRTLSMYVIAIFSGILGGFLGPLCCCGHLLSGAMAVGIYVQSEPEIYLGDRDAYISGAIAGFCAGILSVVIGWMTIDSVYDIFWWFLGETNQLKLQKRLQQYWAASGYFAVVNLLFSVILNTFGAWLSLRWLYPDHRIPSEVQSWTP